MNKTLVIVPTYNERDNLPPLAERLLRLPVAVDLLVVDDNSPDGTGMLADELAARHPSIHVLHRAQKQGLGRAYCAGFAWALDHDYELIMEMDGDFSHNPDDIPKFLDAALDADLVLGSRYMNGIRVINWPLGRLMLSMGAAQYVKRITGMPFTDPTGGFKCFRRRALQSIQLQRRPLQRLQFPDRDDAQNLAAGDESGGGSHHLHRSFSGQLQDVEKHRARGVVDGLAFASAKQPAPASPPAIRA